MDNLLSFCPNCNAAIADNFCSNCGQKRLEDKDRKFRHFISQFFSAAFFLENNVIRGLWHLLAKPGYLAHEYVIGRRKSHIAPLSLFLLINLIYFIVSPLTDLNLSLKDQTRQPIHGKIAASLIDQRIAERRTTFEKYSETYGKQSTNLTKSLIILHVPIMAFLLLLVYLKRKKIFFIDHIIFSLYMMGFVLLISIVGVTLLKILLEIPYMSVGWAFKLYGYLLAVSILVYFYLAIRVFYQEKVVWTLLKTPLVIIAFIASHFLYRSILFFIVYWTT